MLRSLALALLSVLFAGCLQFDAQEITLHYDSKQDQLDALLVYRGLWSNESLDEDLKQLDHCLQTGEFAVWSNWPLKADLASPNLREPRKAFAEHVDVENGGVFTTPTGLLCAFQMVRVRDVKGLLKKVNTALGVLLQGLVAQPLGTDKHKLDDDTRELLTDMLRSGEPFVRMDGGAIAVTLPCSDADHMWLLEQARRELLPEVGEMLAQQLFRKNGAAAGASAAKSEPAAKDGAAATGTVEGEKLVISGTTFRDRAKADTVLTATRAQIEAELARCAEARALFDNPFSLQRLDGKTIATLGFAHRAENTFRKAPWNAYEPNLQPALDEHNIAYEKGVPDQELQRRFAAFHARAAVLPPSLADVRAKK